MNCHSLAAVAILLLAVPPMFSQTATRDKALLGHWPLAGDTKDISGNGHHAVNRGVDLKADGPNEKAGGAAGFDGRGAHLEVSTKKAIILDRGDFTFACHVHLERDLDGISGDLASLYDPVRRKGFYLTIKSNAVTSSQANSRHLQFGIDNGKESAWLDCDRPGKAILVFAMAVHEGHLYAGSCEPGKTESGRVYRYGGDKRWIDCGAPASCNTVTALAVHGGKLYAGVGKYRLADSALPESENLNLGGRVFRYEGTRNGLIATSFPIRKRSVAWPFIAASSMRLPCTSQQVSIATTAARSGPIAAPPTGSVSRPWRYLMVSSTPAATMAAESIATTEINGRTAANSATTRRHIPSRYIMADSTLAPGLVAASSASRTLTRLDLTPDVTYRRAWTAAEHQGRVYFSTLPSGHIHAFEAGKSTAWEHELPTGWHHVAAIKRAGRLELYLDGKRVATSTSFKPGDYDLRTESPLRIGAGANFFRGRLRDVRFYQRSLSEAEVVALARP